MKAWLAVLALVDRVLSALDQWRREAKEKARQDEFDYSEDDSVGFFNDRYSRVQRDERKKNSDETSDSDDDYGEGRR